VVLSDFCFRAPYKYSATTTTTTTTTFDHRFARKFAESLLRPKNSCSSGFHPTLEKSCVPKISIGPLKFWSSF